MVSKTKHLDTFRDVSFDLNAQNIANWHGAGPGVTQFLNALSVFFPDGEKFFMDSVRAYKEKITDEQILKDITLFIRQEALHGREHRKYNKALQEAGLSGVDFQNEIRTLLDNLKAKTPKKFQLLLTIGLEHLTTIMAEAVLTHEGIMDNSHPEVTALWRWHSVDEVDHKSVAYDVYEQVLGKSTVNEAQRRAVFALATVFLFAHIHAMQLRMLKRQGKGVLRPFVSSLSWLYGNPGHIRRIGKSWAQYLKRDYHPWVDHDNHHLVKDTIGENKELSGDALKAVLQQAA